MLSSVTIDNFRGFSHLEMRDLGRVNLLVGMNNCGKTSLLEAIQLLVARGDLDSIYSTADRRGELLPPSYPTTTASLPEVDIRRFFHHYEFEIGSSFYVIGVINNHEEPLTATII
ncbi:AAA family ATPase [Candidatus Entotheonella palauensis]|uniref:AAA family ATPase n=1 Tax=Candidatus Entotheonella palauensis TaxID=93172 RepID=UPI000B7DA5B8|nr:AAA family ATPase [Candidatus Entotheonella palauensis]